MCHAALPRMATRTRRAAHAEAEASPVPGEDEDLEGSDEAAAAAGAANGQEEEDPLQADDPWAPAAGQAAGGDRPGAQSPGHAAGASDGDAPPPEFVKWFYNLWQQQRHQELNGGLQEIVNAKLEIIRRPPRSRQRIHRHRLLALEDPAEEETMAVMRKTGSRKTSSDDGEPRRSPASRHGGMGMAAEMKVKRPAQPPERRRSSLGTVKIEEFYGDRARYVKWKKAIEAQAELYRLEDAELAMLAFGETEEELFERAEAEFMNYRRLPGQSVASYIGQMKRLKAQYHRVDPDSYMSDRARAQRLLNKCSLGRRERLDVFFSAGGRYIPSDIERALRYRCGKVHEDERRLPGRPPPPQPYRTYRGAGTVSTKPVERMAAKWRTRPSGTHVVADDEACFDEEPEDLEKDEEAYQIYLEMLRETEEVKIEEPDELEKELSVLMDEVVSEEDLKEAYAAGWKAKAKQADHKKARGDPECPNVQSGKDKPHTAKKHPWSSDRSSRKSDSAASAPNQARFTFMVGGDYNQEETPPMDICPRCKWPMAESCKFCSNCGQNLYRDDRMSENKRGWGLVGEENEETLIVEETDDEEETPSYTYDVKRSAVKEAAGMKPGKKQEEKIKLKPKEVISVLDKMTKEEKKELRKALEIEEEHLAWTSVERHRILRMEEQLSRSGAASTRVTAPVTKELPKHAREAALRDFRYELYQRQVKGGKFIPSRCSPTPTERQAACKHPFEHIKWTANQEGHYGRCRMCDLKRVLYFSDRHGALVSSQQKLEEIYVSGICPGQAIADTGCRTAVGGGAWHESLQKELKARGLQWFEEPEQEVFQFGAGEACRSHRAYIYPVGIFGVNTAVRRSCMFNFGTRQMTLFGITRMITGEQPEVKRLKDVLVRMPHTFAFVQQDKSEATSEEETEEPSEGWQTLRCSSTSHEFGIEVFTESGSENSDEEKEDAAEDIDVMVAGNTKSFSKSMRSKCGRAAREIRKAGEDEIRRRQQQPQQPQDPCLRPSSLPLRKRWKVLEVFTWTCCISMMALERGWHMCEPVTLPGWDLRDPQTREEAHNYIDSQAPDLLVLAWPCSPWSSLQNLNCRTPEAVRRLAQKRKEHRPMLEFVGEAEKAESQRRSFKGMAETVTDMCQFGLRKPAGEGARRFMKKPTRLVGTPEVIRRCSRRCKGSHKHTHIFGYFKWRGKWRSLSQFAGGYTPDFAQEVVIGAEEYLRGTRRPEIFVEGAHVPEERFEEFENEEKVVPEEDLEQRMLQEELMDVSREEEVPGGPATAEADKMLRLAGADGQLLKECRELLQCPVCEASQAPRKPMQQAPSMRPVTFNASAHLDLKYAKDCKSKLYVALSMIDHATNFHRACLLRTRRPAHVANKFVTQWCALFGDPTELVFDQGGEFEKEFLFELEKRAIHSKVVGAYAPWQNSFAERQGALLGAAWHALIVEHKAEDWTVMKQSLAAAVQAKNATVSRREHCFTKMFRQSSRRHFCGDLEERYFVSWRGCDIVEAPFRPYNEAKEMMRGLKSVQKVIRHPLFRKRVMAKRRQKQKQQLKQKAPEEKPIVPEPLGGVDVPVPEGGSDYEPTSPRSSASQDFWPTVQQIEKWYDEIDDEVISDHSDSPRVRRRRSLDDVPDPIRQKRSPDEQLSEEQIRKKFKGEFFQTVMVATAVEEFQDKHKGKANLPSKEQGKANAWLPRSEVKKLRRLLDMPITAARLHKQPRKRMQRPPGGQKRGRVVVMLSKRAAMVSQETLEEVQQQPRRKAPFLWRGMTLFTKPEEVRAEENMAYVQLEEELFEVRITQPQAWREMVERERKLETLSEALILKLKSSGKELDPRLFDKDEAAAFAESDKNEWGSWIKNKVIERISPDVAWQVDRSLVFRTPLRMVRTNKSKEAMKLIAKSRLVVPGHLDPQLGDYRTDSPTVASVAARMTKIICAMKKWSGWFFDVSTAFLSGKNATRQILVKAPPEGLPAVDGMKAVRPHELMRIVKSAYGLPEAPRLWYLRLVELLEEGGMQEVPFREVHVCPGDPKKTVRAICDLHVDDGFLAGEEGEFHFEKLKQYINEHFNIKKFKGPSYADVKKANKTLKDMKALAESGGAILKYPYIGGEVMFVTYFDASLGKEEKGQSQQGAVHFITSVKAETQPANAGILEFNSGRVSRVVRSSMAAEAASMMMAADHQLYNRLLWEALTKGQLETGILGIRWCPTFKQYADALTKEMDTEQFTVHRQFWELCMKQTEQDKVLEERRAALRRGQRERRKLRMAA
ncbi:unnamed protein product [Effrenium voratum]|uniref:Integrase catalytic domain-containing protein n=1 Tax=Effrenium voratum TaxID=2562239 RepID=A0AA36JMI6_9DINO|nr:unnamed protein product [Effrenium voratum]